MAPRPSTSARVLPDSAPGRLIWLAVGIAVAVAATGFAITLFNNAKARVPDPTPPIP